MEQNTNVAVQKPLVVLYNEARQDLIALLNHYLRDEQIPSFILEPIVKELYTELKLNADQELQQGYQTMKSQKKADDEV
jgi:uncharacterized phage-associated protein